MSRLAANWVESTFNLDKPVVNIEKEFSNGYLFIEMLAQKQLFNEDDLIDCKNGDKPKDILQNMQILTRGLKKLGVILKKSQVADVSTHKQFVNAYSLSRSLASYSHILFHLVSCHHITDHLRAAWRSH